MRKQPRALHRHTRLSLHRETLHRLSAASLEAALGGVVIYNRNQPTAAECPTENYLMCYTQVVSCV